MTVNCHLPMDKKKIIIGLIALIIVLAGLFLGTKFLPKLPFFKRVAPVTLTYWGILDSPELINPLIEKYQEEHPNVTIEYQQKTFSDFYSYRETLWTRLGQETGPDIIRLHNTWVPFFASALSPAPEGILSAAEFTQMFYPAAQKTLVLNGQIYAVPLTYDGLALYYNKKLFSEAGIVSPPETWEELRRVAKTLTQTEGGETKKGRILQSGLAMGAASNVSYFSDILGVLLAQSKVSFPDELTSKAAQDALGFYTDFVLRDGVWDETFPDSLRAFSQEKVAMVFAPSLYAAYFTANVPSLRFGIAPLPQVPKLTGQEADIYWAGFWVEGVSKVSKHQKEAWEFLRFLTSAETQKTYYETTLEAFAPLGKLPAHRDLASDFAGNDQAMAFLSGAEEAVSFGISNCSGNDAFISVMGGMVDSILTKRNAEEATKKAHGSLVPLFEANGFATGVTKETCEVVLAGAPIGPGLPPVPPYDGGEPGEILSCLSLQASPSFGESPLGVNFTVNVSDATQAQSYNFDFGDGSVQGSSNNFVTHTYSIPGTYAASVRLLDTSGSLGDLETACQTTVSVMSAVEEPPIVVTPPVETSPSASPGAELETGFSAPALLAIGAALLLIGFGISFWNLGF